MSVHLPLAQLLLGTQVLGLFAFAYFALVRLKTLLQYFQQEEYDNIRFPKWIAANGAFDRKASLTIILLGGISLYLQSVAPFVSALAVSLAFVLIARKEQAQQKLAKKPLVMTSRATRIFQIAFGLAMLAALASLFLTPSALLWLLPVQLCPLFLILANLALAPFEARLKAKFWTEAHDKVVKLNTFVIGITGSYGKTSTKHILGHILQFHAPTLVTPGSVNTPMGVARIIREQLRPSHKYVVIEMGAYGPGSIARLCRLTPPQMGILTAIGVAHLERFGSRETTARAKMELATAVAANKGKMILNADLLPLEAVAGQVKARREGFVTVGEAGDFAYGAITLSREGLSFTITEADKTYAVTAPVYGTHHAHNIAFAFAAARAIGMAGEDIVRALKTTPQVTHRLEVKKQPNGALLIDDAYNSNPTGFESALHLAKLLKGDKGKAILITPGMVELGKEHDSAHRHLGGIAAATVDVAYVVVPGRIPSFIEGLKTSPAVRIETRGSFKEAYAEVLEQLGPEDVVLLENDLPDLYERKLSL